MTVYVDDMKAKFGRMVMCHMIADSDEELRAMALKIGVRQKWHQGDHFDICLEMRAKAVTFGAVEITQRQCAAMNFTRKLTGALGSPEGAEERMLELMEKRRQARSQNNSTLGVSQ
jgi:hypothetical protein